jgi:ABC-type antimicrobial peptide transport system, permease component
MKSYLKFLSRNKLYTAIEAVGLAVSLAFVIIIGSYVWQQYAVTREHPDGERIYVPGLPDSPALTYGFPDVVKEIPEIDEVVRLCSPAVTFGGNEVLYAAAVDPSFFRMFPFYRFLEGNGDVLLSPSNVIVSESFATRKELSLGDDLLLDGTEYTVGAIFKDVNGTVFQSYELFLAADLYKNHWQLFDNFGSTITFLKVRPGTDRKALYDKLETVCKEVYPDIYGRSFFDHLDLFRYDELFFRETNLQFRHGDLKTIRVLLLVGLLLLLSAIFNYVNLSVALTGKRAKEMAMRQLSGASRGRIVSKYIGESILFTAVCFGMGLLLAEAFCPMMNRLLSYPDIPIRIIWSPGYILAYIGIVIAVGAVCGAIPAVMAGKYKALDVMKGGFRRKTKMVFSKVFIVIQNALAVILVALAVTMEAQMHKTQNRPMHCNIQDKFNLSFITMEDQTPLKDALERLPFVKRIGKCSGVPGTNPGGQYSVTRDGKDILYRLYRMDSTAFRMFDFEILKDYNAPIFNSVWFSDDSFAATGFDDDYQDISVLSQRTTGCDQLAGVFKAFPTNSANMGKEEYAIISVVRPEDIWVGSYLIETDGDRKEAQSKIMETYEEYAREREVYLNYPSWLDENIEAAWEPARNNMRLVEVFTLLSIIISLLGLLAMSTYYADEKSRDIAVRKVFGGTVDTEAWHTIRDYMALVGIACIIGIPVAVYAAQEYLKDFIYRLEGYWWIFVAAVVVTLVFSMLSVLWQTLRAARTNPALELKKE